MQLSAGGSFVASDEVRAAARGGQGVDAATTDALVENYEDAQLEALKTAFLFAALLVARAPSGPPGGCRRSGLTT